MDAIATRTMPRCDNCGRGRRLPGPYCSRCADVLGTPSDTTCTRCGRKRTRHTTGHCRQCREHSGTPGRPPQLYCVRERVGTWGEWTEWLGVSHDALALARDRPATGRDAPLYEFDGQCRTLKGWATVIVAGACGKGRARRRVAADARSAA